MQIICFFSLSIGYLIALNKILEKERYGKAVLISIGLIIVIVVVSIISSYILSLITCNLPNAGDMCKVIVIYYPFWLGIAYLALSTALLLVKLSIKVWKERKEDKVMLIYLGIFILIALIILLYLFLPKIL